MSWLWTNETTEQAQIVVTALQSELDARDDKIKALETALRREQHAFSQSVQSEIKELEERRSRIQDELAEVNRMIKEKQSLLKKGKSGSAKKKKAAAKEAKAATPKAESKPDAQPKEPTESTTTTTTTPAADAAGTVVATKMAKKPAKTLPMDDVLTKVSKVEPHVAFVIQRSTNSNTVVYAAQLGASKKLDSAKPMHVYWIMYEKDGAPTEELNMIERNSAYGITHSPLPGVPEQYAVQLASLKDRDCVLLIDENGNIQARTTINGKKGMVLRRVFVQMTSSWGIPTVDYIEIFGVDPNTHASVYEKKLHKK
ncbi:hypothetical protein Poli38472_010660 [Pythium oligandrum]|uniref:DUF4833 domain-containing protein n=1 Tax=Pythium oligandrum TaxID=41045 RepID=A0A8K1C3P8_PYTOL|nr:hypothetical protein Poli38472_010660 [Pythium oligandrum]|eukprot:TMW55778.1 hypothetical protein Poli38472_010660 [Pythium oligandrum]